MDNTHVSTAPMTQAQYHRLRLMQDEILHGLERIERLIDELRLSIEAERESKH